MVRARSSAVNAVTSRDVARAANVSQALVSRAFTGNGRIAAATRERILKVAAELGWHPNALAASMVTGDAPLVSVITTRLSFDWRAQVLSHLLKAFEKWHLQPLLFYADNDDEVDRLLGETISWRTRGVVVTAGVITPARAEAILSRGQFLAALNRPGNHPGAFSIATDNPAGGGQAASLLLAEGRQRFLVLAGPEDSWASSRRVAGFVEALAAAGHRPLVWHNDEMTVDAGQACAACLLALPAQQRPDAVFSTNDAIALGFIDGLRADGPKLPAELSLIGFDNLPASSWAPYRMTTFEQRLDVMVAGVLGHIEAHQTEAAAEPSAALSGLVRSPDGVFYCPPRLVVRQTTMVQS
ncbi:DNA-binding LacI/PurR family transcriptional regulator [Devosia sp. UYZn731]|uniref:LacI family DNA-binding transcriptional regulator n=1 Tax=Devosia sp. UYZn731 TaxID=3156345 RepID=UPI003391CF78